ncbi:ribosome assembly factor SBDS [Candidatus Woesearchaeota archaeon]|nr:ribosome assembly factor SBDS [Candidatus Woesearchaeota archaeon]
MGKSSGPITFDHEKLKHFNLARLKKGGQVFEIVINPDEAIDYKNRKVKDLKEVLRSENIFHDAKKGIMASETAMKEIFETEDKLKIADMILQEGEIQLTAEHREKLREAKKKRIITLIARNACDPKTGHPHPPQRIENAIEEAKVKFNEFKSAEDQVNDVVKQIRAVLPIKFEQREIEIRIPPNFAAKSYSILQRFGKLLQQDWKNDGSLLCVIEIPVGLQNDLLDELNQMTHGGVETKILRSK